MMRKKFGMAMAAIGAVLARVLAGAAVPLAPVTAPSSQSAKELTLNLDEKVTLKLVLIPAGKFMMGSAKTEKDRGLDETQHEVTISQPFYMGVTHVTVDQFAVFANASGYKTDAEKLGYSEDVETKNGVPTIKRVPAHTWRSPDIVQNGDHPVVQISWSDATAFCGWLSKKSGKTVGLPTEAQWEYACRAGTTTAYPWGDKPDDGKGWANCADQSLKKAKPNVAASVWYFGWDDGFANTSPVGSFKPNAFGLYDMIGNAYQWCQDRDGNNNGGATSIDFRVLRGGSWHEIPRFCRSATRDAHPIFYRTNDVGFRVVVTMSEN